MLFFLFCVVFVLFNFVVVCVCSFVLFYDLLCCFMLFCFVLFCFMLCYDVLFCLV